VRIQDGEEEGTLDVEAKFLDQVKVGVMEDGAIQSIKASKNGAQTLVTISFQNGEEFDFTRSIQE